MSGQEVTVLPIKGEDIEIGQVVLARVSGRWLLHLVKAIDPRKGYLIANNHGHINGWTKNVVGVLDE